MIIARSILIFIFSFLLISCATISGGLKEKEITFISTPEGATVIGEKGELGKTPITLAIAPGDTGIFTIKKEHYKSEVVMLTSKINKKTHGNIVLLPLYHVGVFIDSLSNARYTFKEDKVEVTMTPTSQNA